MQNVLIINNTPPPPALCHLRLRLSMVCCHSQRIRCNDAAVHLRHGGVLGTASSSTKRQLQQVSEMPTALIYVHDALLARFNQLARESQSDKQAYGESCDGCNL